MWDGVGMGFPKMKVKVPEPAAEPVAVEDSDSTDLKAQEETSRKAAARNGWQATLLSNYTAGVAGRKTLN